ncbi:MAG: YkgJ family cysteine cluster protein [Fibrobacterota bacterium]
MPDSDSFLPTTKKITELYNELPPVPCRCCGECCVSPNLTIIEFVYLTRHLLKILAKDELRDIFLKKMEPQPLYEGNYKCRFQDPTGKCLAHPGRALACRLHGMPVVEDLKIDGQVRCGKISKSESADIHVDKLRSWLERLTELNREVAPYYQAPYYIAGFIYEAWLDVYFDELLDDEVIGTYKEYLHKNLDLEFFRPYYKEYTGLKSKIQKISMIFILLDSGGEKEQIIKLLKSVRDDYPETSTYFYKEAGELIDLINKSNQVHD